MPIITGTEVPEQEETMLQPNQTVYYTSSLLVQEATFLRYDGDFCILSTPFGDLKNRPLALHDGDADHRERHSLRRKE